MRCGPGAGDALALAVLIPAPAMVIAAASTAAILIVILPVMIPLLLSCDARPEVRTLSKVHFVRLSPYSISFVKQGLRVIGQVT
jgi:hypothetical protein